VAIAEALRGALEQTSTSFKDEPPADTGLPNEKITDIMGGTRSVSLTHRFCKRIREQISRRFPFLKTRKA
jgi:hypothetical protein